MQTVSNNSVRNHLLFIIIKNIFVLFKNEHFYQIYK